MRRRFLPQREVSAFGTKRTFRGWVPMSAFGGKADMRRSIEMRPPNSAQLRPDA